MRRTFETLAAWWCAGTLVTLIFSTMIEPMREYIGHFEGVGGYLVRWFVAISPAPIFYFLSTRQPATPAKH
jgi:hypothetical protein